MIRKSAWFALLNRLDIAYKYAVMGFTTCDWYLVQVTVFSTSEKKKDEALNVLKANHFIVSKDEEQMKVRAVSTTSVHLCYSTM